MFSNLVGGLIYWWTAARMADAGSLSLSLEIAPALAVGEI
jgi:hypothetical protein